MRGPTFCYSYVINAMIDHRHTKTRFFCRRRFSRQPLKGRWIKGRDCQTLNPTRCKGLAVCARMEILSENSGNTVNAPTCCRQPRAPRNRRDPPSRGTRVCVFVPGPPPPYVSKQSSDTFRIDVRRYPETALDFRFVKLFVTTYFTQTHFSSPLCFRPLRPYRYTSSISALCLFSPSDFRT